MPPRPSADGVSGAAGLLAAGHAGERLAARGTLRPRLRDGLSGAALPGAAGTIASAALRR
jgi:hypothetical protein